MHKSGVTSNRNQFTSRPLVVMSNDGESKATIRRRHYNEGSDTHAFECQLSPVTAASARS